MPERIRQRGHRVERREMKAHKVTECFWQANGGGRLVMGFGFIRLPPFVCQIFGCAFLFVTQLAFAQSAVTLNATAVVEAGKWRMEYNLKNGTADIFCGGKILIPQVFAVVRLRETVTSKDFRTHKFSREKISDKFGRGVEFIIESSNDDTAKMIQTFWLYEKSDYILADVKISTTNGARSEEHTSELQ